MITRFRIEGQGEDKQELIDELAVVATRVIAVVVREAGHESGHWECTDDVISGDQKRGYKGRMVLKNQEGML